MIDIYFERERTVAVLLRFYRIAGTLGRMPSLFGREVIPSSRNQQPTMLLEADVAFVCDVERCLDRLEPPARRLLVHFVFDDKNEWAIARQSGLHHDLISQIVGRVLDVVHEMFCRDGLLTPPRENVSVNSVESKPRSEP